MFFFCVNVCHRTFFFSTPCRSLSSALSVTLSPCRPVSVSPSLPLLLCMLDMCSVWVCGVCRCLWLCVCVVVCVSVCALLCVVVCVSVCVSHTLSRSRYTYTYRSLLSQSQWVLKSRKVLETSTSSRKNHETIVEGQRAKRVTPTCTSVCFCFP